MVAPGSRVCGFRTSPPLSTRLPGERGSRERAKSSASFRCGCACGRASQRSGGSVVGAGSNAETAAAWPVARRGRVWRRRCRETVQPRGDSKRRVQWSLAQVLQAPRRASERASEDARAREGRSGLGQSNSASETLALLSPLPSRLSPFPSFPCLPLQCRRKHLAKNTNPPPSEPAQPAQSQQPLDQSCCNPPPPPLDHSRPSIQWRRPPHARTVRPTTRRQSRSTSRSAVPANPSVRAVAPPLSSPRATAEADPPSHSSPLDRPAALRRNGALYTTFTAYCQHSLTPPLLRPQALPRASSTRTPRRLCLRPSPRASTSRRGSRASCRPASPPSLSSTCHACAAACSHAASGRCAFTRPLPPYPRRLGLTCPRRLTPVWPPPFPARRRGRAVRRPRLLATV